MSKSYTFQPIVQPGWYIVLAHLGEDDRVVIHRLPVAGWITRGKDILPAFASQDDGMALMSPTDFYDSPVALELVGPGQQEPDVASLERRARYAIEVYMERHPERGHYVDLPPIPYDLTHQQ